MFGYCFDYLLLHNNLPQKFHFAHSFVDHELGKSSVDGLLLIIIVSLGRWKQEDTVLQLMSAAWVPLGLSLAPHDLSSCSDSPCHLSCSWYNDFRVVALLTTYLASTSAQIQVEEN